MEVVSRHNYLGIFAATTLSGLLIVAGINAVVDPLWVYHSPWLPQRYVKDQRHGNPGIARFSKYDAVVIGNSLTENFLESELRNTLGWNPLKLCIKGSTAREQRLVLDQALTTKQVKDVLWGVDFFAFNQGPEAVDNPSSFPFHLYERNASTPWKYLLSASTLTKSLGVLCGDGAKDLEARTVWYHRKKFGAERVLTHWRSEESRKDYRRHVSSEAAWQSAKQHLISAVQANPDVRFHIVFPPYSALYRVAELTWPGDYFATRLKFKRDVANALLVLPNVEVFDFEVAQDVTHDLDRYTDMTHFDLATSTAMLRWIAEGKHRVTPESIVRNVETLAEDSYQFAVAVFSSDHPHHQELQIEQLGLSLPARRPSISPPARLAANPDARRLR